MKRWILATATAIGLTLAAGQGARRLGWFGTPRPPDDPLSLRAIEAPQVLFAGCNDVTPAGACLVSGNETDLWIWVDVQARADLRVQIDGVAAALERTSIDGGVRLRIALPEVAHTLEIAGIKPRWDPPWTLHLVRQSVDIPTVETPAQLEHLAQQPKLSGLQRLVVLESLRSLHYQRGDVGAALRYSKDMIPLARQLGRPRALAQAASAAAFVLAYQANDASAALPFLRDLDEVAMAVPEARAWAAFSHGIVARQVGDTTRALDSFSQAIRMAERLGMLRTAASAMEGLAITLGELARGKEAARLSRRMLKLSADPSLGCRDRTQMLNTAGWVQLLLAQAQLEHLDPSTFFEDALALAGPGGPCPNHDEELNIRINLALTDLDAGHPASALAWLEQIFDVPPSLRAWIEDVRARAGLELGRWELVPSALIAPGPDLPRDVRWNAWMRQAAVRRALGWTEASLTAYAQAEAIVDEGVAAIGLDLGRELYVAGKQASARGLVRGLVESGQPRAALCRARLARGRALRLLDRTARLSRASADARRRWETGIADFARRRRSLQRSAGDDWKFSQAERTRRVARRQQLEREAAKSLMDAYAGIGSTPASTRCESLPPLPDQEVLIALFPVDGGWVVFVADREQITARLAPASPGSETLPRLRPTLSKAASQIDGAQQIRVLPTGRSWDLRLHAMAWGQGHLLDVAPVVYGLDLDPRKPTTIEAGTAVLIADPSVDLPLAREEIDQVTQALAATRWSIERLEGAQATRDQVTEAIGRSTLLHYAGHGKHAGSTGWDAALLLHDNETLSVADVLALPRGPKHVVLSGCETGRTTRDTLEGGMNLGRAFVLAGAAWVIAADHLVSDTLSHSLGEHLYDHVDEPTWSGPQALRQAQVALKAETPEIDWAAFRIIVP